MQSLCHRVHPAPTKASGCTIIDLISQSSSIVLDQTPFYAQGGGQPADQGTITLLKDQSVVFKVKDVRKSENKDILHTLNNNASLMDKLSVGDLVDCQVDEDLRLLHCLLHSGGHLMDAAIEVLRWPLKPGKAYHFPEGPYVEYTYDPCANDDLDIASLAFDLAALNACMQKLMDQDFPIKLSFEGEHLRLIQIGDFASVPCGGTHVTSTSTLRNIEVTKCKVNTKTKTVRISYKLNQPCLLNKKPF